MYIHGVLRLGRGIMALATILSAFLYIYLVRYQTMGRPEGLKDLHILPGVLNTIASRVPVEVLALTRLLRRRHFLLM